MIGRIEGLGDLSHASIVYSRDARYGFVFGRDGGLTKVDLLTQSIVRRVIQSGNSIGGAISQDGRYVAVSNYEPGGVKVFDSQTLERVADIPATYIRENGETAQSKTVGLVDAPGKAVLHMEFTPRGEEVWVSSWDSNRVTVYNTRTLESVAQLDAQNPSGIFFTSRAHVLGL